MDALLDALGFNWKILLANVVNFLILLFLLSKIGLKPMQRFIEKRQKEIQEGIDNAEKASKALGKAQEESRAIISQAQKEAQGILEHAREQSDKQAAAALLKQQEEMEKAAQRAKEDIAAERDRVLQETNAQAVTLILSATEKLLREKVDTDADRSYVEKVLAEMKS